MSLKLRTAVRDETAPLRPLVATYSLTEFGPKTTLDLCVTVVVLQGITTASIVIESPGCDNFTDSLEKLAERLERAAKSIRERGTATCILPDFGGPR